MVVAPKPDGPPSAAEADAVAPLRPVPAAAVGAVAVAAIPKAVVTVARGRRGSSTTRGRICTAGVTGCRPGGS